LASALGKDSSRVPSAPVWSAQPWAMSRRDPLNRLAPAHSSHTSSLYHSTSLLASTHGSDQGEATGGHKRGETDNSDDEYCICINVCDEERDVKDYVRIAGDPSNDRFRYIYDYSWEGLEHFADMYWERTIGML
jgi:hypothetical protein